MGWIAVLLLLVPTAYVIFQIVLMARSNLKTQTAIPYTMSDSIICDGMLAMQETTIPLSGTGVLGFQAANGERVSAGGEIARLFESESGAQNKQRAQRLADELALLTKSQEETNGGVDVEMLMDQAQQGIFTVQELIESNNFTGLSGARADIQLAKNKLLLTTGAVEDFSERIDMLTAQLSAAEAASAYTPIYAPASGYFVSARDSEKQLYTPDALAEMTPVLFRDALTTPAKKNGSDLLGKLILDYRWYYYGCVTAKQAKKFSEGARVELSFPNASSEAIPASVTGVTVDEENDIAKVELLCDHINEYVVTLEHEKAMITFAAYDGIRIDKRALHIVEGKTCVYVQFGNVVYKKNISILFEDNDYILVPYAYKEEENEIRLYDQVVVEGSDLHDEKIL